MGLGFKAFGFVVRYFTSAPLPSPPSTLPKVEPRPVKSAIAPPADSPPIPSPLAKIMRVAAGLGGGRRGGEDNEGKGEGREGEAGGSGSGDASMGVTPGGGAVPMSLGTGAPGSSVAGPRPTLSRWGGAGDWTHGAGLKWGI